MRIDGKVVLITGASEGLGAACAAEFGRAGARLSLTARSADGLRRAGGPDALITAGDLTLDDTRRSAVERTLERFGRIDILINNAGVDVYKRQIPSLFVSLVTKDPVPVVALPPASMKVIAVTGSGPVNGDSTVSTLLALTTVMLPPPADWIRLTTDPSRFASSVTFSPTTKSDPPAAR